MADTSVAKARYPLAEAADRINSPRQVPDSQVYKARYDFSSAPTTPDPLRAHHVVTTTRHEQAPAPRARTPAVASSACVSAVLSPPQESDESKRLSQASYASTSSSRSKKNYKTHVGPWQLGKTLGKGSSARVRLCRHNITNQLAAVKIVNRRMAYLVNDSSLAALSKWDNSLPEQPNGEMRVPMAIEREVAILKLIEHPHIMRLYDIWENRSEIYLVLEYIDQGDLFTFINSRGRLREEVSLYFFRQIMSAITYCHSFNICHRDLKPENILITADLQIKIADFGMAALHQTETHHLATACGSPHYAAPELLKNRQYRGNKADIWSMGVILYAMLSATLPFDDPDLRVMMGRTKKGQYEMPKGLSPEAEDLIRRMLQVNPDKRISLREIWRHPLVQKYAYLDNFGENNGQPPDTRKGFQYAPVPKNDIDPQLLRQLRSMWHMFSEHDLALKLTCEEPNDQKAFYWLLHNYREKQLEDFKPELAHSMSDYHHLKPCAWKKRVSTCEFAQPNASGHGRSVSRFTVISNAAETEAGTIQSYDPYRGSRMLHSRESLASHAKITVHRDGHSGSGYVSQTARLRSGSNARRGRMNSVRNSMSGRPPSSRGSMSSLTSNRHATSHARGPSLRHKRAVDFSHVRKRSTSTSGARRTPSATLGEAAGAEKGAANAAAERSVSPELPVTSNGIRPKAKGGPSSTANASAIFNEELRHFSSNIAKDCDEAFRSSFIDDDSAGGSMTDEEKKQREGSPLLFSLNTTPIMTPISEVSSKPWDSRPLPPLPSEASLRRGAPPAPVSGSSQRSIHEYADSIESTEAVTRLAVPMLLSKQADRRVMSAPAHTQTNMKTSSLPAISENEGTGTIFYDKARIVSAPPHASPRRTNARNSSMEYLSKVEETIRIVHSPTAGSPVKAPKPLNVRKKTAPAAVGAHRPSTKTTYDGKGGLPHHSAQEQQGVVKKKSSWFKRSSRAESEGSAGTTASQNSTHNTVSDSIDVGAPTKKKSFTFSFWRNEKSLETGMTVVDQDEPIEASAQGESGKALRTDWHERRDSGNSRTIEVKQNWLARLFRVKPATSHICLAMSRKRARQEVAILLREWRRYGIRGVQIDKQRNIVFARVGAKNYLNMREVEFAAEVMAVIEHGKKQPLSIVRFTQERGAASSFHRVVETMKIVFESRNLVVADRGKQKMMIKTLNA